MASLFLIQSVTGIQSQSSMSNATSQDAISLNASDAVYYNTNNSKLLSSKNISSFPFLITETHYFENGLLNNAVEVTNNETFVNTHLSDDLILGSGNGVIETPDGQNVNWVSSDLGMRDGGQWVFYAIMLFNNTNSESLAVLNNSIGLSKSVGGQDQPDYIWLLE